MHALSQSLGIVLGVVLLFSSSLSINITVDNAESVWNWGIGSADRAARRHRQGRRLIAESNDRQHRKINLSGELKASLEESSQNLPSVENFVGGGRPGAKRGRDRLSLLQYPSKPKDILWFLQWVHQLYNGPEYYHVQIGAFSADDEQDFFAAFLRTASWSKLMVEPQPHVFKRLENFAKTIANMKAVEAAICEEDKTAAFYMFHEDIDIYTGYDKRSGKTLPFYTAQLASLNRGHLMKAGSAFRDAGLDMESYIVRREVPCLTVKSILTQNHVPLDRVVSLSIDAEGYDDVILLSTNLSEIRPVLIFFECIHWWNDHKRLRRVLKHLSNHGYMWWKVGYEIAAFRVV